MLALGQAGVPDVPAATRLVGLNTNALLDATKAGRQLLAAVELYAKDRGIEV